LNNGNNLNSAIGSLASGPASRQPAIHTKLRWLMTLIWAGFIFYLSTAGFGPSFTKWLVTETLALLHLPVSAHTFEVLHYGVRKLAHLTEYAIFSLLIYASFLDAPDFEWRPRLALRSVALAGLYSLTDEYHQSFVSNRTPKLLDCCLDTTGAALGAVLVFGWGRLQAMRSRSAARRASTVETSKGAAGL
jgi:VanZ family protein